MAKKKILKKKNVSPHSDISGKEIEEGKIWALLAVLLNVVGVLIVIFNKKENRYAIHYAKQSLILFIAALIVMVAGFLIFPLLWFIIPIGLFIIVVMWVVLCVFWIMLLVYSISGEIKELPLVGKLAENFKI